MSGYLVPTAPQHRLSRLLRKMARHAPKATAAGRLSSRGAMLKSPAGKGALAAAIVARSASDQIDPFASMMLEGYLKNDHPVPGKKNKNGQN